VAALLALGTAGCASHAQTPPLPQNLPLAAHPRLLVVPAQWARLHERMATEPGLADFVAQAVVRARNDLKLPVLERKLAGRRLLGVSREFIRRTLQWAFAFQLSGDTAFAERARQEMLAVADFADWNPSHYLDVAEMTTGMAIGYDWLFDVLPATERNTLRRAIVDKGIAQARRGHKTFAMTNNWGQVCIAGMVLGALAVAEDEPDLARDLLAAARPQAFTALAAYRPDGIYPEGPSYWNYGTSYEVLLMAGLHTALGADWGLWGAPGLQRSALFYAHSVGPTGKSFNFADGGEGQEFSAALFYFAQRLGQGALVASKLEMARKRQGLTERFAPLAALWWPEGGGSPAALHFSGQGPQPVAIWRSAWDDPNALYFAIKGGGAAHNHAHMDAGSFVLDWGGERWAKDLGLQDYNGLEQQGVDLWNMRQDSPRWKVFRMGASAHNTLTAGGTLHNVRGMASLVVQGGQEVQEMQEMQEMQEAHIDLTPVFLPGQLRSATRTARFGAQGVILRDAVGGAQPGLVLRWAMVTEAAVTLGEQQARLQLRDKQLLLQFSGTPVVLEVQDIARPANPLDSANPNTRQLLAYAPAAADGSWSLEVRFSRT
jgi:hypothetical protein